MATPFEEKVEELKKKTAFDEDVCGCFLSNYRQRHVCPVVTGGWCKDYVKCQNLAQIGE